MAVSKRIQVLLKPLLTNAVVDLAEQEGETVSRMTAILVEEALTARGLNPKMTDYLPKEIEESIQRESTASERGWVPSDGPAAMAEKTPEWASSLPEGTTVEKVMTNNRSTSDEAQLMKLKLMQELMDQLKSM